MEMTLGVIRIRLDWFGGEQRNNVVDSCYKRHALHCAGCNGQKGDHGENCDNVTKLGRALESGLELRQFFMTN